jgi:hypothetical protein
MSLVSPSTSVVDTFQVTLLMSPQVWERYERNHSSPLVRSGNIDCIVLHRFTLGLTSVYYFSATLD